MNDYKSVTGREIELKLEVAPADLDRMTAAALLTGGPASTTTLTSVYFDTPKQALRHAGLSLRIRHDGDRRIQTVKADGGVGAGLFDRPEWEFEIDGDTPDFDDDRSALTEVIGRKALKQVAPVFRSEISRTKTIATVEGAEIELVVDSGEIVADATSTPVCEIELELKTGTPAGLFALARWLDDAGAVRLGVLSKSERGYLLLAPKAGAPTKAEAILLDGDMTADSAFRAIAWSCLRHYRLNESVLMASGDAGALHQARVALRRLRSGFSLFRSVVNDDRYAGLKSELRWLSGVLGEARNLDVLGERARDKALLERLQAERVDAYRQVAEALASARARRLMLDLAEWLTLGRDGEQRDEPMIMDFASGRLKLLRKRLKSDGAAFADLPDAEQHEVRIEAKKLRYATEFFTSLFPGKKAAARHKDFRDALESYQGILGDLNDQVTGRIVLARLGLDDSAPDAWQAPVDRDDLVRKAVMTYDILMDAKRFW